MEIVKPGRDRLQIWHGSIDFWLQTFWAIIIIGIFFGLGFSGVAPGSLLLFILVGCFILFAYFFLLFADQSLVSYCQFNRASGMVEIRRRIKIYQKSLIKIPLKEINSAELRTIQIQYQWFTLNPFDLSNIKFKWHNSNPVAAVLGFFTGQIVLYRLVLISQIGNEIPITCYETDVFKSKRKLVEQITVFLDTAQPQSQNIVALEPQEKINRAIAQWKLAIETDKNNAEAHYQFGLALYRNKQRQEASLHLKQARDLFTAQGNEKKSARVQEELWQMGLE